MTGRTRLGIAWLLGMGIPSVLNGTTWFSYGGHEYALTPTAGTWLETQQAAQTCGGSLVTINDAAENDWLNMTFPNQPLWIGFYQPPGSEEPAGDWQWISGEPVTYTNWHEGQPNELLPGDDYALMNSDANDGRWFDGSWQDVPLAGWPGPHYGIMEVVPEPATVFLSMFGGVVLLRWQRS
jgi:hypothetical protein